MAHRGHVVLALGHASYRNPRGLWSVRVLLLVFSAAVSAFWVRTAGAQLPQMQPQYSPAYVGAEAVRGHYSGRVLRLEDGSPIADAHVGAIWIEYNSRVPHSPQYCVHADYTRTDFNGNFKLRLYKGERPFRIVTMKGLLSRADPPFNGGAVAPGQYFVVREFGTYEEQEAARGKYERLAGPFRSESEARRASGKDNLYLWENRSRAPGSTIGLPFISHLGCWPYPSSERALVPFFAAYAEVLQQLQSESANATDVSRVRETLALRLKSIEETLQRLRIP